VQKKAVVKEKKGNIGRHRRDAMGHKKTRAGREDHGRGKGRKELIVTTTRER
jgi:hypothetical protein